MKATSSVYKYLLYCTYLMEFLDVHKRLPANPNLLFNDFLFRLKTGSELENPLRKYITDKEFGKTYIENKLGVGTTPTTLCILRTPEEVAAYLPDTFPVVVKPTHSCGNIVFIFSEADYRQAQNKLLEWLRLDYFLCTFEKNYEKLDKKLIVENYIDDTFAIEGSVHCMNGQPRIISLIDRKTKERQSFDVNKTALGVSLSFPLKEFDQKDWRFHAGLIKSARILSAEFSYIRVDFYTDGERVIFGEMTNLPAAGNGQFFPDGGEKKFSEALFNSGHK